MIVAHHRQASFDFHDVLGEDGSQLVTDQRLEELLIQHHSLDLWSVARREAADVVGMHPQTDEEIAAFRQLRNATFLMLAER